MASRPSDQPSLLYSPAVRVAEGATFGLGSNLSWDAYQRALYNQSNAAFTRQATELLQRGLAMQSETQALVDQRNALLLESRRSLSPFGKLYSEILKPSHDLPTYERLLAAKASNEAILQSVGKTRAVVNRLTLRMQYVGRGMVVLNIALAVVVIARARPDERAGVAARQGGALAGGAVGGWVGAWAGCAGAATITSPSLLVPVVGEVTTGGACLVGGIVGGLGGGALGAWAGERGGGAAHGYATRLRWR